MKHCTSSAVCRWFPFFPFTAAAPQLDVEACWETLAKPQTALISRMAQQGFAPRPTLCFPNKDAFFTQSTYLHRLHSLLPVLWKLRKPINDIHLLSYDYFFLHCPCSNPPSWRFPSAIKLLLQFNSYYSVCLRPRTLVFAWGEFAGCHPLWNALVFLSFFLFYPFLLLPSNLPPLAACHCVCWCRSHESPIGEQLLSERFPKWSVAATQ